MKTVIVIAVACMLSSATTGCRVVEYTGPDGRKIGLYNVGFDTKLGKLHAQTPEGSIDIEGLDSQTKAYDLLSEIVKRVPPVVP